MKFSPTRRALALLALSAIAAPAAVVAQDWPSKPIELVVPYPPGGSTDVIARKLGQKLSEALGKPVVVDNKPGAAGNIGTAHVARSAPDGHRLLFATSALLTLNPHVHANPGFDPFKNFAPVSLVSNGALSIGVPASSGIKTLPELVQHVRRNPRKVFYGTPSAGTPQHVMAEMLNQVAGIDMTPVHYKGVAPAINDLIGGQVQVIVSTYAALKPQVDGGRIRVLAVAEPRRIAAAPDVPTIAETYPGFEITTWFGVFAPGGTPAPLVRRLEQEFARIVAQDEIKQMLNSLALPPVGGSAQQMATTLRRDYDMLGKVVREKDIKAD